MPASLPEAARGANGVGARSNSGEGRRDGAAAGGGGGRVGAVAGGGGGVRLMPTGGASPMWACVGKLRRKGEPEVSQDWDRGRLRHLRERRVPALELAGVALVPG